MTICDPKVLADNMDTAEELCAVIVIACIIIVSPLCLPDGRYLACIIACIASSLSPMLPITTHSCIHEKYSHIRCR